MLLPEEVARQSLSGRQCSAGEDVEDDVVDDLGVCKPAQAAPLPGYGPWRVILLLAGPPHRAGEVGEVDAVVLLLRVKPVHLLGCSLLEDLPRKLSFLRGYPSLSKEDLSMVGGRDRILRGPNLRVTVVH